MPDVEVSFEEGSVKIGRDFPKFGQDGGEAMTYATRKEEKAN